MFGEFSTARKVLLVPSVISRIPLTVPASQSPKIPR